LRENLLNCAEVSIKIQVLLLDIQDQRVLGLKERDGAITLVPFGDEIFARANPSVRSFPRIGISAPT
jgi:hypothetical protein